MNEHSLGHRLPVEQRMIGNEALLCRLASEITDGQMSHAYLIEGEHGAGKHHLARLICAAMSCSSRQKGGAPCGSCRSCEMILGGKSPDVTIIGKPEDRATIGVEEVRHLRADVMTPPIELEHRFYIIEDAGDLTPQAQNALLLTLEEPPPYVMFLLLCENTRNILETVRSRAPSLRLAPVPSELIDAHLGAIGRAYTAIPPQERQELLCLADGCVGRALELLDGRARKPLLDRRRFVSETVTLCLSPGRRDAVRSMACLAAFGNGREDVLARLAMMQQALRDLVVLKNADRAPLCFYSDRAQAQELSQRTPLATLNAWMRAVEYTRGRLRQNANLRLALTELLLCEHKP